MSTSNNDRCAPRSARLVTGMLMLALASSAYAQLTFDLGKILSAPQKIQNATSELPQDKEIALGRGIAARLIGAMPLVRDEAIQRYVNDVGWWLVSHTERRGLPWRFAVTDTSTLGAFATPGGHVLITRGLLALMQDEHQLAGVLAHEMAHVLRKHHLAEIMREAQTSLASDVATTALSFFSGSNSTEGQILGAIGKEAFGAGMELYGKGLSREDELDADAHGTVIATRAGYDPAGLASLLFTLDAVGPNTEAYALMSSTHPSARDRIVQIEAQLERGLERHEGTLRDEARFGHMQQRLAQR
jgi:beta-barrel assembly-enhancing protease